MQYSCAYNITGENDSIKRVVVGLPTRGCRWWRESLECVHCPVTVITRMHKPPELPVKHVITELNRYHRNEVNCVCLYTPGSALDKEEIAHDDLVTIVREVRARWAPQKIVLESRPELVKAYDLLDIVSIAKNTKIEICIPLESVNFSTRRLLGKTFTNKVFLEAVNRVKQAGALFSSTVILKPPGLSESGAILDARSSLLYILGLKPAKVTLEPMVVYYGTILYGLYSEGRYRPPWLWSVYAAIEYTKTEKIEIGGEFVYPEPVAIPHNCPECSNRIQNSLRMINKNHKVKARILQENCKCRDNWLNETGYISTTLRPPSKRNLARSLRIQAAHSIRQSGSTGF